MIKKLIPKNIKRCLHLCKRYLLDLKKQTKFAKSSEMDLKYAIQKTQIIKRNLGFEAKVHNLKLAISSIEPILIRPNEIFSFWKIIKNPSKKNGFKEGRTIINDVLSKSTGGGLCQISGLMYHLSLEANLKILERHNHSKDLYDENTRYTPLGSDATVVFGYKDLRIQNNYSFPIRFSFHITENDITLFLHSEREIFKNKVTFSGKDLSNNKIIVTTKINNEVICSSVYKKFECDEM